MVVFKDRVHAGQLLATTFMMVQKRHRSDLDTVIVALPRGGVAVALPLAERLGAPVDILVSKKIGAPDQPEFAIGAVSSSGVTVTNPGLSEDYLSQLHDFIEQERVRLLSFTREQEEAFRAASGMSQLDLHEKRVIVVDDGIATGMTTLAALRTVKELGASYVILASPVMARDTLRRLHLECDVAIAVTVPENLRSIGDFYEDFHQVDEVEMAQDLRELHQILQLNVEQPPASDAH